MKIHEIFASTIQQRIEPVVKVSDRRSTILLEELRNLVITPQWKHYIHQIMQEYTDALDNEGEQDTGIWISGFFGSGKSLLMKTLGTLLEGGELEGQSVHEIFLSHLSSGAECSDIRRLLTLCQRRITCTAIGGNIHTRLTDINGSITLVAFKLFAQSRGYTNNWPFAWAIEAQLDERGLLSKFQDTASKLCGTNWQVIAEDAEFYCTQLYEAAAEVYPTHFSSPNAVEQATNKAQHNGITPEMLVRRLYRWCVSKDKAKKRHKILLQFDEFGYWLQNGQEATIRLLQMQALVEAASVLGGGRIWIVVTTHGDIQTLQQSTEQESYAKINQRFILKCRLSNEDINIIVQERLLRKTIPAVNQLHERFQQNRVKLYDLGSVKQPQRVYPLPDIENFTQYYPYMPWTMAVIPDITKGIAQATGRGEELTGANRTMIAVAQGGILEAKELCNSTIGKFICLADLYIQFIGNVPIEAKTDLSRISDTVAGSNNYTIKVAHALYLLGQARYIPCTLENVARALVTSMDDSLTALCSQVKIELDRLVAAGYVKHVDESYIFLIAQQRSFQEKVLAKQEDLLKHPYYLIMKLKERDMASDDDALRFDQVPLLGTIGCTKLLRLMLDDSVIRNPSEHVTIQVYSTLQRIMKPEINSDEELKQRSRQNPDSFFLRMQDVQELQHALVQAAAVEEIADQLLSTGLTSDPEYEAAKQAKSHDVPEYKRNMRYYLAQAIRHGMLFFRGTAYHPIDGDNASTIIRNSLSQLLPQVYSRFSDLPYYIRNEASAVKDALNNVTTNSDLVTLKVYKADGTLNENNPLLSILSSRIPPAGDDMGMVSAHQLQLELEKPPFGWDSNCVKIGLALLLRASACHLIASNKTYTDPNSPEVLRILTNEQHFKALCVQSLRTEISTMELQEIRGYIDTIFGMKPPLVIAIINDKLKEHLQDLQEQAMEIENWARVAQCSLPLLFESCKSLVAELLEDSVPQVRLSHFMHEWERLLNYPKLAHELIHFKEEHGEEYVEVRSFFIDMTYIDNPLEEVYTFLQNWRALEKKRAATELVHWSGLMQSYHIARRALANQIATLLQETQQELVELEKSLLKRVEETTIPRTEVDTAIAELHDILSPLREGIKHTSLTLSEARTMKSTLINQRTTLFNKIWEIEARYRTAASIISLASLYSNKGKYEQAEPLLKRALAIYEQILKPKHPNFTLIFNNLALLYYAQDKYEQAEPLLKQTLAIYEQILKLGYPDLAQNLDTLEEDLDLELNYLNNVTSLNDLGLLLQEKGDVRSAHLCFEQILKILGCSPALNYPHSTEQQLAIQELQAWMQTIIQDMVIAQTSRSKFAQTTALNRAIGMLSEHLKQLDSFSAIGQFLIKRITDRWREVMTHEASRVGKIEILTEVASPYIFTVPVEGTALAGRDDLFRRITSLWARPGQRNSLLIHGHRRMGKTSLAQALASRCSLGPDTRLVYLSMEIIDLDHEGHLYYEIADRLWLEIQSEIAEPNEEDFSTSRARTSFNRFLARLNIVIKKVRIVLVLDEFELLQKLLGSERAAQVIIYLRAQTQTYHWFTLGLVGLNDLDDLRRSYGNPLLGWESIPVSFLNATHVTNILTNPPNYPDFPLDYAPEALDKIATLTNGQPYLVQVIGDLLVQHYNRIVFTEQQEHRAIFDVFDVQAVVNDAKFYDTAAAYFEGVWDQVTKFQQGGVSILRVLADYESGLDESSLRTATKLDHTAFAQAFDALKRHDVLCLNGDQNQICYNVPLMRSWVHTTQLRARPNAKSDQSKDNDLTDLPTLTIHIDQPDSNEAAPLKLTLFPKQIGTVAGKLKLPFPLEQIPLLIRALNARQYSDYPTRDRLIRSEEDRKQIIMALRPLGLWDDTIASSSHSASGAVPADVHTRVGRLLGSALLAIPGIKNGLDALYNEAIQKGSGEIVLSFHLKAAPFAALPWEIAHNNLQPILLTKGVVLGCTRLITFNHPLPPPQSAGQRLRVLTIAPFARMDETGRAFEQLARSRLRESLQNLPVDIESLSRATMTALHERLNKGTKVDVLDYYGHGSFTRDGGALVMEGESGGSDLVTANRLQALGNLLPPFIVLHACQSAQLDTDEPLAGLAVALSAAGVRAVLAMQFTTRMSAVTNYIIPILYGELAAGKSVQQAVAIARQALYTTEPDGASWYLPALYLRSPNQQPYVLLSRSTLPSNLGIVRESVKKEPSHVMLTQLALPPNPFAGSRALEDAKRFVGRELQVRRLWSRLKVGSNLTIVGPAGSGKSAMLRLIAEEVQIHLNQSTEIIQLPLYPTIKRSDVHKWLVSLIGGQKDIDLARLLKDKHLILLLDDLGLLDKGNLGLEVRSWLRQLSQNRQVGKVQLVATSQQPLHNIFKEDRPSNSSPLHDAMRDIIELAAFNAKEAIQFITDALAGTAYKLEDFTDLLDDGPLMPGNLQGRCRDRYDELCEKRDG